MSARRSEDPHAPWLYPEIAPARHGTLDVGGGHEVYWETCGDPAAKPAIVLHGGPGSGCTPWHRRLFNPAAYHVVLMDQRGCGRSRPRAGTPGADLSTNTTAHLVDDLERLRAHLGIERWLVLGGSWGSTLALAYATRHPERVSEIVLFGVTTGRRVEFDWWFRGGARVLFPAQWERLRRAVPEVLHGTDIVEAYSRLLHDADAGVRAQAAEEWCLWESASPAWPPTPRLTLRFEDPEFRMTFARLVTHYVRHNAWLGDDGVLPGLGVLSSVPAVLVQGRLDYGAPIAWAWDLIGAWSGARLVVVEDAGHAASHPGISGALVEATDGFAGSV